MGARWVSRSDLPPLLLRAALALTFIFSGLERILRGSAYSTSYFSSLGIAAPQLTGPVVSWLEFVSGAALLAGIGSRIAAALLAADMTVALVVVRVPIALTAPSLVDAVGAVRLEVLLLAAALSLVVLGGGRWSLDRALSDARSRRAGAPRTRAR